MHALNETAARAIQLVVKFAGLSLAEEARLRAGLRRKTPSEPWVDEQLREVQTTNGRGQVVVRRRFDPSAFPPGGNKTKMVKCKTCGIPTPPNAIEDGECLDHREEGNWGKSPSAVALAALRYYHLIASDPLPLPPDSERRLRREIHYFQKHGKVRKVKRRKMKSEEWNEE